MKKTISLFLALVLLLALALTGVQAVSTGDKVHLSVWTSYSSFTLCGRTYEAFPVFYTTTASGGYGDTLYCIDPNTPVVTGAALTTTDFDAYWESLSRNAQRGIRRASMFGYYGTLPNGGSTQYNKVVATQILIWEYVLGTRTTSFDPATEHISGLASAGYYNHAGVMAEYTAILNAMKNYAVKPYYVEGTTVTLSGVGPEYTLTTAQDTNHVIENYYCVPQSPNVVATIEDNAMKIYATSVIPAGTSVEILLVDKETHNPDGSINKDKYNGKYCIGAEQALISGAIPDPLEMTINVAMKLKPSLCIIKTAEDGNVANIEFTVKCDSNDYYQTAKTDSYGKILLENLTPGTYTVTETVPQGYTATPASQTVVLESGKTATVTFHNNLKPHTVILRKISEDGILEGIGFNITGTEKTGTIVDETVYTNGRGILQIALKPGKYTATEIMEDRYVETQPQEFEITTESDETIHLDTVTNVIKKFNVTVLKKDAVTGEGARGDATLEGAVYGLYKDGNLIEVYNTNAEGKFTTEYYPCSGRWTVKEITPSTGYLLDATEYDVGTEPVNYTIERNSISITVKEQPVLGTITIFKHSDSASDAFTPEAQAKFQIYLTSAGSYEDAKESDRDEITTNANGYAKTKELHYGTYTVHQTEGINSAYMVDDFTVKISKNKNNYEYTLNDVPIEALLRVIKIDEESGKVVSYSHAGFEVYKPDGTLYSAKVDGKETSVFYTNILGIMHLPEKLPYGIGYKLVEVVSPEGYTLSETITHFDVTENCEAGDNGELFVELIFPNQVQKGTIILEKKGETFASVKTETNNKGETVYIPVYEEIGLEGATFDVYAAEDIVTGDGETHYKANEKVCEIQTQDDGIAKSKELYIGSYYLVETAAPHGMVLDKTPIEVELKYAGQKEKVTVTTVTNLNKRQAFDITIQKTFEQDASIEYNEDAYKDVLFGVYATEGIIAADGTFIPINGLCGYVSLTAALEAEEPYYTGSTVSSGIDLPEGKYTIRETETNKAYRLNEETYEIMCSHTDTRQETIVYPLSEDSITNELIKGSIQLTKVDKEYPDNKLTGAEFAIYYDSNASGELEKEEDLVYCETMEEIDIGEYKTENVTYGSYFVIETKAPAGFRLDEGVHRVDVHEDGKTYVVENKAGHGFLNEAQKGSLKIIKTSTDGKVEGISFRITGTSLTGEKIDTTAITDTTGVILIEDLKAGTYTVEEVKNEATEGYTMQGPQTIEVKDNEATTVKFHNTKGVATGTTSSPLLGWIGLLLSMTTAVGAMLHLRRKNRNIAIR